MKKYYHVSVDIMEEEEKKFIPRVPKTIIAGEDITTPRICVAKTIKEAIGAFPYKRELMTASKNNPLYLDIYVLEIKKNDKNVIETQELKDLVPDAHITGECWVTKSVIGVKKTYKITKCILQYYNKYTHEYSGGVKELEIQEYAVKNESISFNIFSKKILKNQSQY